MEREDASRNRSTRWDAPFKSLVTLTACVSLASAIARAEAVTSGGNDLTSLSLEELSNLEVTSVSKVPETLERAPASIYVITHDDILRSGATSLMEALRLAPNLLVTQVGAADYTIAARGFGGNSQAQNFSNKLLMLIDGRSVYTPLYSGIYSDAQDVLLEDVDRIEVISGPGATLWGANAMNGVINVITRPSYLTQGSFVDAAAGNQEQDLGVRYGGRLNGDTSLRAYGLGFHRAAEDLPDGASAHDGWTKGQAGFRGDWSSDQDSATVQGDAYRAAEREFDSADGSIAGANILTRYQHRTERYALQAQAYFDQTERFGPGGSGGGGFVLHTYDLEIQQSIEAGSRQRIVWGGGERLNAYAITNQMELLFEPERRNLTLGNVFLQDTVSLARNLNLTAGLKMEDDPFWGWTPLPDGRLAWQLDPHTSLWAAASKAIRSPTPFDEDVVEKIGPNVFLTGNRLFRPEQVTAYETGTRLDVSPVLSASLSVFYDDYANLRTIEATAVSGLPLYWGNLMRGDTYGLEGWANWQVTPWWRLSPGLTVLREQLRFDPGASRILGIAEAADDPGTHADITSSMQLGHRVDLDGTLRYVGALPDPALPHYLELNGRLGWRPTNAVDVSINGLNLLHARHYELPIAQGGEAIGRSVMAEARWRF
jgi:iron complex outermembrane receptor protein